MQANIFQDYKLRAAPPQASPAPLGVRDERPRFSIVFKWSAAIGVLLIVAMGLLGGIAVDRQKQTFMAQMDQFGLAMASQLAGSTGEPLLADDQLALNLQLRQLTEKPGILGAALIGKLGKPLSIGLQPSPQALTLDPPTQRGLSWQWYDEAGLRHSARSYWAAIRFANLDAGMALITLDADTLELGLHAALRDIALATLLLIPAAVALGVFLARRLSRPLRTLASISGSLQPGEPVQMPRRPGQAEVDKIVEVYNRLAAGIQEKKQLETLFQRYVPTIFNGGFPIDPGQPSLTAHTVEASVLFCDVTGFTALSEPLPPNDVVKLLNQYFSYITLAAHSCGGVVDSFSGDCAMIVFGASNPDPLHALHAATCALLIRETIARINRCREQHGQRRLWFRIGVNSGPMAQCHLGGNERMQHTVIGDTVNVASRLCGLGDPGEITVGRHTAKNPEVAKRFMLFERPTQPLHGRREQVAPYGVSALDPQHQAQLRQILDRIFPLENP
jgi:adenylate cyclase